MKFKKYPSHPSIRKYIPYYWTLTKDDIEINERTSFRFIPDGYVEWVFHLENQWSYRFANETKQNLGKSHLFGHMKSYMDITIPEGPFTILCAKFNPWAAKYFWKLDMHETTETHVSFSDLNNSEVLKLESKILHSSSIENQISILDEFFISKMDGYHDKGLSSIISMVDFTSSPINNIHTLSNRRVQQLFHSEIGISLKSLQQTFRINYAIRDLLSKTNESLSQIAYKNQFSDQSHFIKSFKKFTGYTPNQFLQSTNPDGDIFNLRIPNSSIV